MEDLSREALQTLATLKRQGLIPSIRPCCGQEICVCDHRPPMATLRDHAPNKAAYDRALEQCSPAILRVLTMGDTQSVDTTSAPCAGTFVCDCPRCSRERMQLVQRGAIGDGPAAFSVTRRRRAA